MKRKIIAGAVLVLFAMSSASVVSVALTASALPHKATVATKKAHDHSCCPGAHAKAGLAILAPLAFEPTPCDKLPCCVKRAPGNPSALPAANRLQRPDVEGNALARTDSTIPKESFSGAILESSFAPPLFVRSTVLRI